MTEPNFEAYVHLLKPAYDHAMEHDEVQVLMAELMALLTKLIVVYTDMTPQQFGAVCSAGLAAAQADYAVFEAQRTARARCN